MTAVVIVLLTAPGRDCFDVAVNVPFGRTVIDLIVAVASGAPYGSTPTGNAPVPKQPSVPNMNFFSVLPVTEELNVTMSSKPLIGRSPVVPANAPCWGSTAPASAERTRVNRT